jgi:replicative DNA helicase
VINDHEILLCSSLCKASAWRDAVSSGITEEFFKDDCQRDLWSAMLKHHTEGRRHNPATVIAMTKLDGTKHLVDRLLKSFDTLATTDLKQTVQNVILAKRTEQLAFIGGVLSGSSNREGEWTESRIDSVRSACREVAFLGESLTSARILETIDDAKVHKDFIEHLIDNRQRFLSKLPLGYCSGIKEIDECLGGGFRPGRMYLVGGRTGGGKTQFAINVAANSILAENRCLFFSAEMVRNDILKRLFSNLMEQRFGILDAGNYDEGLIETARKFCSEAITAKQISIYHNFDRSLTAVEAIIDAEMRTANPPKIAIVDYAQMLIPAVRQKDKLRELQEISATLKGITQRHQIALIVLVQLNRTAESEGPELHHVMGNDSFSHDCDGAILIHVTDETKELGFGLVKMRKMRHGESKTVMVGVDFSMSKFSDLTPAQKAELQAKFDDQQNGAANKPATVSLLDGYGKKTATRRRSPGA